MYLRVSADGSLSLEEADDIKRFHISAEGDATATLGGNDAFQAIASDAGDERYWLKADAIATLSGKADDDQWMKAFDAMLEKAASFGFADTRKRLIKAHVE